MDLENKEITVKDILDIIKGKLIIGNQKEKCENFCFDTRKLEKNNTYIALKGEKIDGSIFWKDAFNKGANVVIIGNISITKEELEEYSKKNKTIIQVEDTLKALWQIATYKRNLYNIPVVGITGSVGKTSTKDMIANVISQKYKTLKTEGNNNNHIGLPSTILRLRDEEAAVVEMGMNHFGEIQTLTNIAKPTISVITNIGTSHIGNLGSRENILKAKLEILEGMNKKVIVINNDNDLLHDWFEKNKQKYTIITYGIENKSEFMAKKIVLNENSTSFTCKTKDEELLIQVPVGGKHFVYNALCAVAVGKKLNISNKEIVEGIKKFELTKKRMEVTNLRDNVKLINDAYNASYESIKEALNYIANLPGKRKIAVLGDVFELGTFAKELHQKIGKEVANKNIDLLICCGENSKYICEEAIKNGMLKERIYYEKNIQEVTKRLKGCIMKDDVILIKASNGMKFFDIASEIIEKYK